MNVLKRFFRTRETYLGIAAALILQLVFFSVWLTGYDGINDRVDQLKIAVTNEDTELGKDVAKTVAEQIPFKVTEVDNLTEAKEKLDLREWDMVIHIPKSFTEDLQEKRSANLNYYINQANPTLSKQIMEKAAETVTDEASDQAYIGIQDQIKKVIPKEVAAQASDSEQVEPIAEKIVDQVQKHTEIHPVKMSLTKTNNVEGFSSNMLPLLVILASFIGAMIMSMQFQIVADVLKDKFNKWAIFLIRLGINIVASLMISLLTVVLMRLFGIDIQISIFSAWMFQSLLFFSFVCLTQMFVILFGIPGMVFNIIVVAIQLVSSGVMVPRDMLSSFYARISEYLPATYGVDGYFSIVYGGGDLAADVRILLIMTAITLVVALGRIAIPSKTVSKQRIEKGA